jgi:putative endonuclease
MAGAFVYILRGTDGSYYTGLTKQDDPEARVWEHNEKIYLDAYTSTRLPVTLVFAEYFELVIDAIAAERRIKKWSRAKKEAMMAGDWQKLVELSKRRGGKNLKP